MVDEGELLVEDEHRLHKAPWLQELMKEKLFRLNVGFDSNMPKCNSQSATVQKYYRKKLNCTMLIILVLKYNVNNTNDKMQQC